MVVAGGALLLAGRGTGPAAAVTTDLGGVAVVPRSEWGGDLAPAGPLPPEPDVRYLLVHHSVDPGNGYALDEVAGILRGFVRFHTSPEKGWPDLAYNFLVDRFGRVWEGRTGSLAGPVAGDATGGNQGFDQLCCFIGDHQTAEPTPDAFAAMSRLLHALAARSGISLADGATATFTSRGSNRHPAGTLVTTPTVAGHRDMSRTQCPGDRVAARLPELRMLAASGSGHASPPTVPAPAPPAATASTSAAPAPSAATSSAPTALPAPDRPPTPAIAGDAAGAASSRSAPPGGNSRWARPAALVTATAATGAAAAALTHAARAGHREESAKGNGDDPNRAERTAGG